MHFAHILSDNTTSCQLRSEESALSCPRRPRRRSRGIAHRKCAFFSIRPIKKAVSEKRDCIFWGGLLKYRWCVVGCGVPDAPCTARKFGAAPDACTCHCRGAACPSPTRRVRLPGSWYKSAVPRLPRPLWGLSGSQRGHKTAAEELSPAAAVIPDNQMRATPEALAASATAAATALPTRGSNAFGMI